MSQLPKGIKKIMSIKDEKGLDHWLYGDDFALMAIIDVLEKIRLYEAQEVKENNSYDA